MESAAAKARAQMSQNDFSPPARLSSWGDSGRVWRMRHKFWLPRQMYSKRREPLCAGGKAVVRPGLFVRLRRMRTLAELIPPCADPACLDVSQDGCFRHPDGFRGLPESVTHVLRSVP